MRTNDTAHECEKKQELIDMITAISDGASREVMNRSEQI